MLGPLYAVYLHLTGRIAYDGQNSGGSALLHYRDGMRQHAGTQWRCTELSSRNKTLHS